MTAPITLERRKGFTPKQRAAVFQAAGGRCHICGGQIQAGQPEQQVQAPHRRQNGDQTMKMLSFSPPMLRAKRSGLKTMTRRGLRIKGAKGVTEFGRSTTPGYDWTFRDVEMRWHDLTNAELLARLPFQEGDIALVREALINQGGRAVYDVDGVDTGEPWSWKPNVLAAMYMPARLARDRVRIIAVKVERLQEISEADAVAEGIARASKDGALNKWGLPDPDGLPGTDTPGSWPWQDWQPTARDAFARLWQSINGPGSWEANPWVAAYSFKRIER